MDDLKNITTTITVTAPKQITVELVRADTLAVVNTFRTCFECSLAVTSALLGAILSIDDAFIIHYIFLAVVSLATLAFLGLFLWHHHKLNDPPTTTGS